MLDIAVVRAEERRNNAGVSVASDGIAGAKKETATVDTDTSVLLYIGREVPDHPNLASGCDSSHRGIRRTSRDNTDASIEPDQILGPG